MSDNSQSHGFRKWRKRWCMPPPATCVLRSGPGMARGIPTRQGQGNDGELDEGSAQGYEQLNARALVESIRSMS